MAFVSPIQRLPPEVLHMIFQYLLQHIPELRLLCKSFADIGLHYLLTSYHLIFKKSSFERLLEISQHPVLSKCVKSIVYEADTLTEYDTRKEWQRHITNYDYPDFIELSTLSDRNTGTARAQRASHRAHVKCMQEGIIQIRSLLLGALESGRKIEELHCGYIDWKLFKAEAETFARLQMAVQNLRVLGLFISTKSSHDDSHDESKYHEATAECASYLEEGRLRDFASAAPNLTSLLLEFDSNNPQSPARLIDVVGANTWPSLRMVYFSHLSFTEDALLEFYRRHSTTIKIIGFDNIKLLQGTWQGLFPRIRETLELEDVRITGELWESAVQYDFGISSRFIACFGEEQPPLVKRVVEGYLLEHPTDLSLPDLSEVVEYEAELEADSDDTDQEWADIFGYPLDA
ncbi:MAG: hypothetical protein Q9195_007051 [Heterodermia aff. obscurata]